MNEELLVMNASDVEEVLDGCESEIVERVKKAYELHELKKTSLPHSSFLRFPDNDNCRIIALPSYIGGSINKAGVKWISSFPDNILRDEDRASASLILNSSSTGRTLAFMEASQISSKRTAASAALAAKYIHRSGSLALGILGCGLINFEILKFILCQFEEVSELNLFDICESRSAFFKDLVRSINGKVRTINVFSNLEDMLKNSNMLSIATTASEPYLGDVSYFDNIDTVLNVSLRDISPEVILSADNVVDDISHVSREKTSIHLSQLVSGNNTFVRCSIGEIILGNKAARSEKHRTTIVSPFGLGILDIALAELVYEKAKECSLGTKIQGFHPRHWRTGKA